jgi:hypothetical protein
MDTLLAYMSEVVSFVAGACLGSFLTIHFKKQRASGRGNVVDQSGSRAGGDIVGRDKRN